jgi:alcohol dehydrogenase class IV
MILNPTVEALYAQKANPITTQNAISGITAFVNSLPRIRSLPSEVSARIEAQYGAFMCSLCVATVGTALHHKMCHVLGGTFNLPHMETHALLLPHSLAYNLSSIRPELIVSLTRALSGGEDTGLDAVQAMDALLDRLGIVRGLSQYGLKEEDVDRAADIVAEAEFYNPKPVRRGLVRDLIWNAWAGERARADR